MRAVDFEVFLILLTSALNSFMSHCILPASSVEAHPDMMSAEHRAQIKEPVLERIFFIFKKNISPFDNC
jgi:hypothetical protein